MARKKPLAPIEIRQRLMAASGGAEAHDLIELLEKTDPTERLAILAEYARKGPIDHVRQHATSLVAESVPADDLSWQRYFEDGLNDPAMAYWSVEGLVRVAGRESYPRLTEFAENSIGALEARAFAIRAIAVDAGQHFVRGLPSDPGYWPKDQFPWKALREWADAGYPRGPGYESPKRDAALDAPSTDLEVAAARLDAKLARVRNERQDPVCPTNWLTPATSEDMAAVQARWALPSDYAEFLCRFSPLSVCLPSRKYDDGLRLYGAAELIDGQYGYARDEDTVLPEWPENYLVIGDRGADPFVLDLSVASKGRAPVLTALHGMGDWDFTRVAPSFLAFLKSLGR